MFCGRLLFVPDTRTRRERFQYQFRLRKLLLWTVVAALGCGVLSTVHVNVIGWLVLPLWFVAVLSVRWRFGGKWATQVLVITGILLVMPIESYGSASLVGVYSVAVALSSSG